jgi:large subunit ribosomal protein L32
MAVQKSRKSPSKSGMKRAHSALTPPPLSADPTSGEIHRRHHITKQGYIKGKKALRSDKLPG